MKSEQRLRLFSSRRQPPLLVFEYSSKKLMLWTQKLTFLNSDFFAKSEIQNSITISKIMKLVQKLNSQQQIEHGGHFYCRHG